MKSRFTKRANKNYLSIRQYLINEFGILVADDFRLKFEKLLDSLEAFPDLGIEEVGEKQIRSILITKQTRLYYRVKDKTILILALFDVRQDPKKRPLK